LEAGYAEEVSKEAVVLNRLLVTTTTTRSGSSASLLCLRKWLRTLVQLDSVLFAGIAFFIDGFLGRRGWPSVIRYGVLWTLGLVVVAIAMYFALRPY
jgi:hypothetical protein